MFFLDADLKIFLQIVLTTLLDSYKFAPTVISIPFSSWWVILMLSVKEIASNLAKNDLPLIPLKVVLHCITRNIRVTLI